MSIKQTQLDVGPTQFDKYHITSHIDPVIYHSTQTKQRSIHFVGMAPKKENKPAGGSKKGKPADDDAAKGK